MILQPVNQSARTPAPSVPDPIVHVVDDEPAIQELFRRLGSAENFAVRAYGSADEFLDGVDPHAPGCLVLDLNLPDRSGLEVLTILSERGYIMPVVFMSGCAGVNEAVRALKLGSLDFVQKPFDLSEMLAAIRRALEANAQQRTAEQQRVELRARFTALTPREAEVMELVVEGLPNKLIATRLGISPKTVEVHRSHVMQKTRSSSLAELVRLNVAAGLAAPLRGEVESEPVPS
ncbi:MAG: response regulator transcription factor [Planctomycetota bacterium]